MRRFGGMHIHVWRQIDSQFRLITARRNPNMVILVAALLFGRPDIGLELVAWWTIISLIFHAVRLAQASERGGARAEDRHPGWRDRWTACCSPARGPGRDPLAQSMMLGPQGADPGRRRADGAAARCARCSPARQVGNVIVLAQEPERLAAGAARRRARRASRSRAARSPQTIAEHLRDHAARMAGAGDDRRPCAARPGDGRRVHAPRPRARTSPSGWSNAAIADARFPQTRRTWIGFRGGALHRRQSVRLRLAEGRCRRSSCGARSSRTARRAGGCLRRSARRCCSARCSGCARSTKASRRSAASSASTSARCELSNPLAGDRRRQARGPSRWSKPSSPGAHERPRHLRHGPDGHAARDLHAVPAPLRDPPGAVAAAVPAARRAVDARLRRAADRPRRS